MRSVGLNGGFVGIDKRNVMEGVSGWEKNFLQTNFLLDKISNTSLVGAWGLRKLRYAYTGNACEIRNSSSNAVAEIGFFGQDLNIAALATHTGSNNGLTSALFDQSGNARHFLQTTPASQPRLVSAGTVEVINTKPAIFLDGTDDSLIISSLITSLANNNDFSIFLVIQKTSAVLSAIVNQGKNASYFHFGLTSDATTNAFRWRNTNNDFQFGTNTNTIAQLQIISVVSSGGTTEIFRNGTSIGTTANGITAASIVAGDELALGKRAGQASEFFQGRISIMVLLTRALSTGERQTLEADCGAYYGITIS
jgi:hypothetical protein